MNEYPDPPDYDDQMADAMTGYEPDPRLTPPPTGPGPSSPIGPLIVNWRTLRDDQARAVWDALRDWVEWLTVRYRISESVVPACWYRHGQLVEELSALHTAHLVSFDPADTGYGPIGWHERLSLAVPRLTRAYSGGCARGHDEPKPRSWTTDDQEWDAWTRKAHAH